MKTFLCAIALAYLAHEPAQAQQVVAKGSWALVAGDGTIVHDYPSSIACLAGAKKIIAIQQYDIAQSAAQANQVSEAYQEAVQQVAEQSQQVIDLINSSSCVQQ